MFVLTFGSQFPASFFSDATMKKEFIAQASLSRAIADGRDKIADLIREANLSSEAAQWCGVCFAEAPLEFFYMPTSSTGKYHGGQADPCNCVGGNIVHTEQVLNTSAKVLNRYEGALGVFYEQLSECLKVGCLLHDIAKYSTGDLFVSKTHGESGAELIQSVESAYDFRGLVCSAVCNHMYYWRFLTVYDAIATFGAGSLNGLFLCFMLSECDYYSFK